MAFGLYFDLHVDYPTREITVRGEFDAATASCLATAVAGFQRSALGDITIHLDDVTFMDMSGLTAIADARSAQRERGDDLAVLGANAEVRRLFILGKLAQLLRPPEG